MKKSIVRLWMTAQASALSLALVYPAQAQIVGDPTTGTVVNGAPALTPCSGVCAITGGTAVQGNLFHSFSQFSVGTNGVANFITDATIQNVISRVTGGTASNIDGVIRITGSNASFFLLNPNGIFFGPNASLDIRGSFIASTASSLQFNDGNSFSATNPTPPILTMRVPVGLQFGSNPGPITVLGPSRSNLQVSASGTSRQTLALVGGNVTVTGGSASSTFQLDAPGGVVALGSVAGNQVVGLAPSTAGWSLNYAGVTSFQDIQIANGATVSAGNGSVQIQARNLTVTDSSVFANTGNFRADGVPDAQAGGGLRVNVTGTVLLDRTLSSGGARGFFANRTVGAAAVTDLTITANQLIVRNGAVIRTQNFDSGVGGNLTINTGQLLVQNANISATTFSRGPAGNLTINASDAIRLSGTVPVTTAVESGGIFAQSFLNRGSALSLADLGSAGNLTITTPNLTVLDGATISVTGQSTTNPAGNLTIAAPLILLNTGGALRAETRAGQGNLNLVTSNLQLRNGSRISTNATGTATGGNLSISTRTLVALENSDITANAQESFGGRVSIRADGIFGTAFRAQLTPESDITATSALGPQFSGSVTIQTPDIDPSQGLVQLQAEVVDPTSLVAQGCSTAQTGGVGEFIITGRGGLPPSPSEPLADDTVLVDLGKPLASRRGEKPYDGFSLAQGTGLRDRPTPPNPSTIARSAPLIQAQGWMVNAEGKVVLLAQAPTAVPQGPWLTPASCNAP